MTGLCAGCGAGLAPSRSPIKPRKWCSERCRKASYGDPCVDCGTRTAFGAQQARVAEPRCTACSIEQRRRWTPEIIVDRIQEWERMYGEPPAAPDWNAYQARHTLHDEARARRYELADGYWPAHSLVYRIMGSWGAALVAAGFEPRASHGGGGNQFRKRALKDAA